MSSNALRLNGLDLTLGILDRSKVIAAHGNGLLEKDCKEDIEECGKAEIDQGQATAEKRDGTDTNEESVVEYLDLSIPISLGDWLDSLVCTVFNAHLGQELFYKALRSIERTECDLPFPPSI